ncbi:MAG: ATP-dependent DNA helicase RecQ [Candidatus Hydrogenedentes bacterium ADurb.Bin179]|nr:MAG: ATP-dependent DNA helicase RecQ [Candidatus Hydrogenedentes bacterium ADurb.Bin179]
MQLRIFTIPFSSRLGGFDDEPLRSFIADKQVLGVECWHFLYKDTPYWSFAVQYVFSEESPVKVERGQGGSSSKVDWRKRLSDKDWPVFNALREWRKARASDEGVPPYLIFTNEQLTQLVLGGIDSLTALGRIAGIGPSRVEKYGKEVLRILHEHTRDKEQRRPGTASADRVDGVSGMAAADNGEISEEGATDADEPDRQPGA